MTYLWTLLIRTPLYNGLVLLTSIIPGANIGIAVIILTLIVRFILFPLGLKASRTQLVMRSIQPEIDAIKKAITDKTEQGKATFALYKKYNINPFSSFLLLFIQLPVIFALYSVFYKGLVDTSTPLYSFVHRPEVFSTNFLGLSLIGKSIVLAVIVALSQIALAHITLPKKKVASSDGTEPSFAEAFSDSMAKQSKYILPLFMGYIAYITGPVIALYLIVSNLFSIGQELYVRKVTVL
jgi:YidC/Oxa1 family membrane protein insertase